MGFTERGGWWVVAQVALFGLFALAMVNSQPVREGVLFEYARVIGWILVLAAVVAAVWALALLGRRISPYPAPVPDTILLQHGPYRYVRHPIYGALCIGALGLGLAYANPLAVLMSLAFPLFFMAKSGHEEDRLVEAVPEYRDYRIVVPYRLIPWVL